jgi:hypothetical protein
LLLISIYQGASTLRLQRVQAWCFSSKIG